jgi:DNA mismatch repair protein MutS
MVEHLHAVGALTLFATHYHELTHLAQELPRVRNFNESIVEDGDRLAFTRKLVLGEADKSYGIQVARMAGLPAAVVGRAHEVMDTLVAGELPTASAGKPAPRRASGSGKKIQAVHPGQLSMLEPDTLPGAAKLVLDELKGVDINSLTPLEALTLLSRLKERLNSGDV